MKPTHIIPDFTADGVEPDALFHLAIDGPLTPATAAELPERVSDLPAFYYWKDAIVAGSYVHPAGRFSLNVTRDRLDGYVNNFNRMRDNGVGVPILMDHSATAEATLGWIVDVRRDGDRLLELHQFLGESARDIGLRNKVSLGIDPHFVDGKGNQYGEAIVHSAVTPVPVVPGQGEFVAMELSLAQKEMQNDKCRMQNEERGPVQSDECRVQNGERSPTMDFSAVLSQVIEMKRDLALARGGVDAAVAAELFELLVKPGEPLLLSRGGDGTMPVAMPIAMAVFDALSRNRPVLPGESTGLQVLSRVVPGEDGALSDLRERMIALASGNLKAPI
jgi:hypothetical protein